MEIRITASINPKKTRHNLRCPKTGRFVKASKAPDFVILSTDAHRIGCQNSNWETCEEVATPIHQAITKKPIRKFRIDHNAVHTSLLLIIIIIASLTKIV